jgi:hypothetical protein
MQKRRRAGEEAAQWRSMHCLRIHPSVFAESVVPPPVAHQAAIRRRRRRHRKQTSGCEFSRYLSVCIVGSLSRVSTPFIRFSGRGFKQRKSQWTRPGTDGMDGMDG